MRCDVSCLRTVPCTREAFNERWSKLPAALAKAIDLIGNSPLPSGMALHAMAHSHEIGPLLNRIAKCRLGKSVFSVGICVPVHRRFVDRVC